MLNSLSNSCLHQRIIQSTRWVVIIIVGILLLALRNPDPILNPIIYTEDGQWIGVALTKGWLYTFENAKEGYFVWGNLLLLLASVKSSEIICGNSLICLPQSIAFFSYLFFSFVATLAYFTVRNIISQFVRIFLFALMLLMPLGDSGNEIIGRLSNIGYLCVFCSVLLMFNRISCYGRNKLSIDVLLIVCAATNPVCVPIIFLFGVASFIYGRSSTIAVWVRANAFLVAGLTLVALWVAIRSVGDQGSSVTGSLQLQSLIEVGLARSILYPFIFWMYHSLENIYVIILTFLLLLFGVLMWLRMSDKNAKVLVGMTAVALLIYLVFTLVMRQSLTEQLGGYRTTFPDRYFMGLNYLVLFAVVVMVGSILRQGESGLICWVGLSVIAVVYLVNLPWIFETKIPRMKIATGSLFNEEICLSGRADTRFRTSVVLPTYFQGWSMEVPIDYVIDAASHLDCTGAWSKFFITDDNWNRGVGKSSAVFFLPDRPAFVSLLAVAKKVRFTNGEVREIIRVEQTGTYLNVFLEGQPLDGHKVGLPNEIEVIE